MPPVIPSAHCSYIIGSMTEAAKTQPAKQRAHGGTYSDAMKAAAVAAWDGGLHRFGEIRKNLTVELAEGKFPDDQRVPAWSIIYDWCAEAGRVRPRKPNKLNTALDERLGR